jgi:hypothetical protein
VRWTGQVEALYSELYTFYTQGDDGVRLWVNGQQLVNNWTDHSSTENSGTISLTAGQKYTLTMEFYDDASTAIASLSWSGAHTTKRVIPQAQLYAPVANTTAPVGTGTGLRGDYFDGMSFDTLIATRTDPTVGFDWEASPATGVSADQFSVRWTGQVQPLYTQTYTFYTLSDDGIRLWVNGQQIVNNWTDHGSTENSGTIALTAGQKYDLKLEFYDNASSAIASLSWSAPSQGKQVIPSTQLYPATAGSGSGGTSGSGGKVAAGGTSGTGGTVAAGGTSGTGGTVAAGGTSGTGGKVAAGGSGGSGSASGTAGGTGTCNSSSTIQLIGNRILDTSGKQIVARGPEMVVADSGRTRDIDTAAAMGANAARLLLTVDAANGMTPATFDTIVGQAVSHNMLVWISLYTWDGTNNNVISSALGGGNFYSLAAPAGSSACSFATPTSCYLAVWSRQWLKDLVAKYKGHVIVDAMQEYVGVADASSEAGRTEWATAAQTNIKWFRSAGYTVPLEIMTNFQGRDLYAIVEKGASIRAADTIFAQGYPQTMFGWQAYWASSWYKGWQGGLLLGGNGTLTGAQAIHQFVATEPFPIEIGLDNYGGDTAGEYKAEMDQAAVDGASWLWWSWTGTTVECPLDGTTCQAYVTGSPSGFAGAVRSTCGLGNPGTGGSNAPADITEICPDITLDPALLPMQGTSGYMDHSKAVACTATYGGCFRFDGSDTLTQVIHQAINASGACLSYHNIGSGQGEKNIANLPGQTTVQGIAPMSRNFVRTVTGIPVRVANVVALDAPVVTFQTLGSQNCWDLEPGHIVGDLSRAPLNSNLGIALGGYASGGVSARSKGTTAECADPRRLQALNDLASCQGVDQILHIYRPDDNSGTQDTFRQHLQFDYWCNGNSPGNQHRPGSNRFNEDLDPIRRPCIGADATKAYTKCTYFPLAMQCFAGDPTIVDSVYGTLSCTQGVVVALSENDPGTPDVTTSIGRRVGLDLSHRTVGLAGLAGLNPANHLSGATINAITYEPENIRLGTYMFARRLFLMGPLATSSADRNLEEGKLFTYATSSCGMIPIVQNAGFVIPQDPPTCGNAPCSDFTNNPLGCGVPDAGASAVAQTIGFKEVCNGTNPCVTTGTTCASPALCGDILPKLANTNACNVDNLCASGHCTGVHQATTVCAP